jgi:hypothetical protein
MHPEHRKMHRLCRLANRQFRGYLAIAFRSRWRPALSEAMKMPECETSDQAARHASPGKNLISDGRAIPSSVFLEKFL